LPIHFLSPVRTLIAIATDGIAVRYEPCLHDTAESIELVSLKTSLVNLVPELSHQLIRFIDTDGQIIKSEKSSIPGVNFSMQVSDAKGNIVSAYETQQVFIGHVFPKEDEIRFDSLNRPYQLGPTFSSMFLHIEGEESQGDRTNKTAMTFETRSSQRFPMYWDSITIYPHTNKDFWRHMNSSQIATADFFAIGFGIINQELDWQLVSSQKVLREKYLMIVERFEQLLSQPDIREELLQQFLNSNPQMLVPGYKRVLPKVPLGSHVTDFVVEDHLGRYTLIELERADDLIFTKSGQLSAKATHARSQIQDWLRYLQDNKATVEREIGLQGISATPSAMVVMGRSAHLNDSNRAKLRIEHMHSSIEFLTYDELLLRARSNIEQTIGSLVHARQPYEYAVTHVKTS
jgi:Domain of unknown function (DUF4263)